MDVLGSTAKGLIGVTEKAVIYVPSIEFIKSLKESPFIDKKKNEHISIIKQKQAESEKIIREKAKVSMDALAKEMKGGGKQAEGEQAKGEQAEGEQAEGAGESINNFKKVGVQYNPKSLIITGLGGISRSYGQGFGAGAENQIVQIDNKTSLTLSCELVFTNVNISDAFMTEDLMNLNIESAASNVMNITDRAMGKSPSVQPMVDGFISIVTTNYTRWIIFAWGKTVFRGELTRVECNYKMFNKRGDPIIATVNISIRQGFEDSVDEGTDYWRNQFLEIFKAQDQAQEIAGGNPL